MQHLNRMLFRVFCLCHVHQQQFSQEPFRCLYLAPLKMCFMSIWEAVYTEHFTRQGKKLQWSGKWKKKIYAADKTEKKILFEYSFCLHLIQREHLCCRNTPVKKQNGDAPLFFITNTFIKSLASLSHLSTNRIIHQTPMRQQYPRTSLAGLENTSVSVFKAETFKVCICGCAWLYSPFSICDFSDAVSKKGDLQVFQSKASKNNWQKASSNKSKSSIFITEDIQCNFT